MTEHRHLKEQLFLKRCPHTLEYFQCVIALKPHITPVKSDIVWFHFGAAAFKSQAAFVGLQMCIQAHKYMSLPAEEEEEINGKTA